MEKTLTFLKEHNIDLTPENYKIFYCYFNNSPKRVTLKVKKYITSSPSFTQKSLDALYAETFNDFLLDDRLASFDKIIGKINRELAAIFDAVHDSDIITDTIHEHLRDYSLLLKKEASPEAIKIVISNLLNDIEEIRNTNYKLKKEVDETSRQIELLSKDFEIAKKESMYDSLTGLYNRRVFEKRLKEEISRFKRYGTVFCISFIDVDDFKTINDTYSHTVGDKVLKSVADHIEKNIRHSDISARYGGDEFAIIFLNTDLNGAVSAAENICSSIKKKSFTVKGKKVTPTVSIGVAIMKKGMKAKQLIDMADKAMYRVKQSSKDSVCSEIDTVTRNGQKKKI